MKKSTLPVILFLSLSVVLIIDSCKKNPDSPAPTTSTTSGTSSNSTTASSTTSSTTSSSTTSSSTTSSSTTSSSSFAGCSPTDNFYQNEGGSIGSLTVTCSNGGATLTMDDGSEVVTVNLGSLPASNSSATFNVVDPTSTPGTQELSIKVHYYGGNNVEDLTYNDSGKTASVCNNNGKITVKWIGLAYKYPVETTGSTSKGEMTCP